MLFHDCGCILSNWGCKTCFWVKVWEIIIYLLRLKFWFQFKNVYRYHDLSRLNLAWTAGLLMIQPAPKCITIFKNDQKWTKMNHLVSFSQCSISILNTNGIVNYLGKHLIVFVTTDVYLRVLRWHQLKLGIV